MKNKTDIKFNLGKLFTFVLYRGKLSNNGNYTKYNNRLISIKLFKLQYYIEL